MNIKDRAMGILTYGQVDRLPTIHFGFWNETLVQWKEQGHLTAEEIKNVGVGSPNQIAIAKKLGFEYNWADTYKARTSLFPRFEREVLEVYPDGKRCVRDENGVLIIEKEGTVSIPMEVGHSLHNREDWEELFVPRLKYHEIRVVKSLVEDYANKRQDGKPLGIHCGSLFGRIRNWMGVEQTAYMLIDDEDLYDEIIDTVGNLTYKTVEETLKLGTRFDYAHFWEDICYKNGPLISPNVFAEKVGPHYKRITDLLKEYGVDIVSVDCDGKIDNLLPIWLENGVNTMFPIEVGTWEAEIKPWKDLHGKSLRGIGGMNKNLFAQDYAAIDKEIERLKPLIALGGYIPCPDHLIPPGAKWEVIQYYTEKIKEIKL